MPTLKRYSYNFELNCFNVAMFFDTQCILLATDDIIIIIVGNIVNDNFTLVVSGNVVPTHHQIQDSAFSE